ncbi:hypothetical protein BABINDRAFT_159855 [Babjeviella inositovora NRRL Y-12698]|uniref:Needs CLA4 to survive protein 3 n=1 Tax=Babjeviella inositovora NRRL Y-12698 TaxID=984486 RepID=A0A1E3QVA1_9ASCO|nr:uncharacterized protein BABINDRAFT_159855 [Babjeviella inositovora NRRL Y-12698]ODQ81583.1 hypothetical protein BABINDRAFT_159855 [Babjeviella inositovora NRRL Y-12698]
MVDTISMVDTVSYTEQIKALKRENEQLKQQLNARVAKDETQVDAFFTLEEYLRYGRQMTVRELGISGQRKLKTARVLVIGAGGLGCPALLYLAGAGVGKLGIVDNDVVDTSNLHRQVLHSTERVGQLKCESAKTYLQKLNPFVEIETYPVRLLNSNSFAIFRNYEVILDCTDTPITRYLISDTATLCGLPVVSGSGLRTEGQLSILNFNNTGPCYRCFYPRPPPPNAVTSCSDGGVLGPAIGLVGVMMALETLKLVSGAYTQDNFKPFLTVYAGYPTQSLRTFNMRGRKADCKACSLQASITEKMITSGEINYTEFCGRVNYNVLQPEERVSVEELAEALKSEVTLLDVRAPEQFEICSLPKATHISLDALEKMSVEELVQLKEPIYVVCRFGNDSQLATRLLKERAGLKRVWDVKGGVSRWADVVDLKFPKY